MPPIDECLRAAENEPKLAALGGAYLKMLLRRAQAGLREELRAGRGGDRAALLAEIIRRAANAAAADEPHLRPVVNATGVVLHTNLGRAILAESAIEAIEMAARSAVNLEYDLESGERGDRDAIVEEILCALTGAEAATVVNNNAAAVLLVLGTLALGREVVVSRGELIEIGGAFRIPDVMTRAGARPARGRHDEPDASARLRRRDRSGYRAPDEGASVELPDRRFHQRRRRSKSWCGSAASRASTWSRTSARARWSISPRYGLPHEPIVADRIAAGAAIS